MEVKGLRDMGNEELVQKRRELREQIFHLRLRRATGQMENPMKLRQAKRDLARVETVLSTREKREGRGRAR
ncbi:MAG: 50S ribosomal protein L29 [Candidatus Binatia bacterium]